MVVTAIHEDYLPELLVHLAASLVQAHVFLLVKLCLAMLILEIVNSPVYFHER